VEVDRHETKARRAAIYVRVSTGSQAVE
jgi:hypothetical protein